MSSLRQHPNKDAVLKKHKKHRVKNTLTWIAIRLFLYLQIIRENRNAKKTLRITKTTIQWKILKRI